MLKMVGFISVTIRTPRDRGGSGGFVVYFCGPLLHFLAVVSLAF